MDDAAAPPVSPALVDTSPRGDQINSPLPCVRNLSSVQRGTNVPQCRKRKSRRQQRLAALPALPCHPALPALPFSAGCQERPKVEGNSTRLSPNFLFTSPRRAERFPLSVRGVALFGGSSAQLSQHILLIQRSKLCRFTRFVKIAPFSEAEAPSCPSTSSSLIPPGAGVFPWS